MRDLLFFALCCLLAAAYQITGQRLAEDRHQARQRELYLLGAPQSMDNSPERWLLLGDFARGLRNEPSSETFEKLAPLFLASHDLKNRQVRATAYHNELLGRVIGKTIEFFDAKGEPLSPKLWLLGEQVSAWNKPLFETALSPTLVADGPWLLYQDNQRSAVFRMFGDTPRGFISTRELGIDEDVVTVDGKKTWLWSQGRLEPAQGGG